jgi:hypothetical protein
VSSRIIVASAFALLLLLRPGTAAAASERVVRPGTPSAAHALRLLTKARRIYKMSSQSYTATNPTLDRYYMHKVAEADRLIDRLKRGRAVSLDAVDDALDSEDARQLGGHPMPITDRQRL